MNTAPNPSADIRRVLCDVRDGRAIDEEDYGAVTGLLECLRCEYLLAVRKGRYKLTAEGLRRAGPRLVLVPPVAPHNDVGVGAAVPRRHVDPARAAGARRGWEHRRERDEAVAVNLPADLLPLWDALKSGFSGTPEDRARAFLEYVHDHEREAIEAVEREADAEVATLVADAPELPPERVLAVIDGEIAELQAERAVVLDKILSPF